MRASAERDGDDEEQDEFDGVFHIGLESHRAPRLRV